MGLFRERGKHNHAMRSLWLPTPLEYFLDPFIHFWLWKLGPWLGTGRCCCPPRLHLSVLLGSLSICPHLFNAKHKPQNLKENMKSAGKINTRKSSSIVHWRNGASFLIRFGRLDCLNSRWMRTFDQRFGWIYDRISNFWFSQLLACLGISRLLRQLW